MKKNYILAIGALFLTCTAFAQTQTLEGFKSVSKKSITPIINNNEVKGYTLFFEADKADRKNTNYGLAIYDEDLKKVKEINLVKPKDDYMLVNNVYNDAAIAFMFYNFKEKSFEIESYSRELNKLGSKVITDVTTADNRLMKQSLVFDQKGESGFNASINIFAVPQKGFIKNSVNGHSKGWVLEMYDNSLKNLWRLESGDSKEYENIVPVSASEKYVLASLSKRNGLMSTKMESFLVLIDIATGKKIFEISAESDPKEQLSITGMYLDETTNEIITVGDCYNKSDKPGVARSTGFYIKRFSPEGKELSKKSYAWSKDIKLAAGKQIIDNSFINFTHKIAKTADGKTYIITEQYKRNVSAMGVASLALGGGSSVLKGIVGNMLVFVVNPDLTLAEVKQIAKDKSTVALMPGIEMYGPGLTGLMMKMMGDFDYQFLSNSSDGKTFNAVYVNYDKEKQEKTKKVVGNIIRSEDGKLSVDKIDVTGKTTSSFIYPAKPGYIMMVDFLKKEKQLGLKLIKVNG